MSKTMFNQMSVNEAVLSSALPAGKYDAVFSDAVYIPPSEGDPTTGKGRQDYPKVRFTWVVKGGEYDGRAAFRDVSINLDAGKVISGPMSAYHAVMGWILDGNPMAGGRYKPLDGVVGQPFKIVLNAKERRSWIEVQSAMRM